MKRKKLDTIYMMILPGNNGIVYRSGAILASEVWEIVIGEELLGSAATKKYLHRLGYRVKRVEVYLKESK